MRELEESESLPAPPAALPLPEKPRDVEWRNELQKRVDTYRENQRAAPARLPEPKFGPSDPKPDLPPIRDAVAEDAKRRDGLPPLTRRLMQWNRTAAIDAEARKAEEAPPSRRPHRARPPIVDMRPLRPAAGPSLRRPHTPPTSAPVSVRLVAGLMDIGLVLLASGLFAGAAHLLAPEALEGEGVARLLAVAFFLILQFYWFSFVRFAGRTAGMSWLGLHVLNFDGGRPSDAQRWQRAFGTSLSATALGLGFAWAVADEQRLTWHDRMSKTLVVAAARPTE